MRDGVITAIGALVGVACSHEPTAHRARSLAPVLLAWRTQQRTERAMPPTWMVFAIEVTHSASLIGSQGRLID